MFGRPISECTHVEGAVTYNPVALVHALPVFSSWCVPDFSVHTGVFLPLFSVTRRTARTLPLYEQVNRRCKAFTLFHLLAFVACTIRTWSLRTLR